MLLAAALLVAGASYLLGGMKAPTDAPTGAGDKVWTVTSPRVASVPKPPGPARRVLSAQRPVRSSGAAVLEERLRGIAGSHGGKYGVVVLDPSSGKSASIAANETFGAASIGKLPALITLYKAAARGDIDLDEEISILPSDVQGYGSGVLHTYPVGTRISLRECAYLLVNESDNTAWVMLERYLGKPEIQSQLARLGARGTDYAGRTTTPNDVLLMLQSIADPSFTSGKLSGEMITAMTDTYLEDRIPAGLPPDLRVAHKTGSYGNYGASGGSFGDAGIVFLGGQRRYFVVILSDDAQEADARAAMQEMSRAAYESLSASH